MNDVLTKRECSIQTLFGHGVLIIKIMFISYIAQSSMR